MTDAVITVEDIEGAERLLGLAYTARERQQMVGNLAGQIDSAVARRKVAIANSVPMASRFDPRLPGFSMPKVPDSQLLKTHTAPLPDSDETSPFRTAASVRRDRQRTDHQPPRAES